MVDMERHARHLVLPKVGIEGQEKLANAKVFVVGAGGLGSPVLLYLAAAGIGTIGIIDDAYLVIPFLFPAAFLMASPIAIPVSSVVWCKSI